MEDKQFTIVTVAFEGDTGAMGLQARSMARFLPRALVREIIVVENGLPGTPMPWRQSLLAEYGCLADLVTFKTADEVATLPKGTEGWWGQQVLKLEVARQVSTPAYLLLDGKHHLVKPLTRSFLEDDTGRLRIRCADYQGHPLSGNLESALEYFGLEPSEHSGFFPTTTPPFPMKTSVVIEIIDGLSAKHGDLTKFMTTSNITEFFLYSAYLTASDRIASLYDRHQMPYPMIWAGQQDDETCRRLIEVSANGESPFFGLHRKAAPLLSAQASSALASYWAKCGLFDTQSDALAYLDAESRASRQPRSGLLSKISKRMNGLVR